MVYWSMRNGSRVVDELYIKIVLLALEDFLFFSLYWFSCIAKQVTTLKLFRLLSCLDFLETNVEPLVLFSDITLVSPISPTPDPARYKWEQCGHHVNSLYLLVNKITRIYSSNHQTTHCSNFSSRRVLFKNRTYRSLRRRKWMTCWQGNPISYAKKWFIRFMLQWRPLCMGLKRFPQQNIGNFRCAWTEPDKQQRLDQMLIVRRQLSDWSAQSIKWHLLNASFLINYFNVISDNNCSKLGRRQPVPEANSPKNLPYWKLVPKTRLAGRQLWQPTIHCNIRSAYLMLIQKAWPAAWLVRSGSLPRWRARFMASPQMNRSGSRLNSPSTWLSVKLCGRESAFRRSGKPWNTAQYILDI